MSLTLVFFLVLFILFLSTYIGFFLWKHLKIIKYMPALVGFISVLFIFIWKRISFSWEALGFGTLQYTTLSRYLRAIRLTPQNLARTKKLGGSRAARRRPIGEG